MDVALGIAGAAVLSAFVVSWCTERNNDEDGAPPGGTARQWAMGLATTAFAINIVMSLAQPSGPWRWVAVLNAAVWMGAVVVWAPLEWRRRKTRTVLRTHRRRSDDRYTGGSPPGGRLGDRGLGDRDRPNHSPRGTGGVMLGR